MSPIVRKGVIQHGQVVVTEPINLPDGSEVTITGYPHDQIFGEDDNDRPPTAEEIAASLAAMEKIEPFVWTDEERATWEVERRARKEWEKFHFAEHAEELRKIWE
jgi:hypothetical protein